MHATWRTEVVFSLSTMEAERLHDLLLTALGDDVGERLTDDERAYVETFLRLLRDPANPVEADGQSRSMANRSNDTGDA